MLDLLDATTGEPIRELFTGTPIGAFALSPAGTTAVASCFRAPGAGVQGSLCFWDLTSGDEIARVDTAQTARMRPRERRGN